MRNRTMGISVAVGLAVNVGFYGVIFLIGLGLQEQRGLSAMETGLAFLSMAVVIAGMNVVGARVAERFGPRVPITGGQLALALALLVFCAAPATAPTWTLITLMIWPSRSSARWSRGGRASCTACASAS